ncbi:protein of unknown function [Kyrpidia spormannii]|uniref:Uncharacterized protein n=1 Tax=Kyrpidia spormannii TaxID=2055160 RepID=A0A6F9ED98_9BACL|nr:protein of unknown function [Kyrpidia spormannii]
MPPRIAVCQPATQPIPQGQCDHNQTDNVRPYNLGCAKKWRGKTGSGHLQSHDRGSGDEHEGIQPGMWLHRFSWILHFEYVLFNINYIIEQGVRESDRALWGADRLSGLFVGSREVWHCFGKSCRIKMYHSFCLHRRDSNGTSITASAICFQRLGAVHRCPHHGDPPRSPPWYLRE